jgi:hypothetical protein
MTKLLQAVMVFAVAIAVLGSFAIYGAGRTSIDLAFAQDAPPPDDGGSCCDAPPPDDGGGDPPPDDGSAPPPDDGKCCDEPPPDDGGTYEPAPDGGYFAPPEEFEPSADGEYIAPPEGFEPPPGEFFDAPPTGEFFFDSGSKDGESGDFQAGDFNPGDFDPGDYPDGGPAPDGESFGPAPDPGFTGTFSFDERGDFVFDGDQTLDGPAGGDFGPGPGDPEYFPDGDFHDFFNPGDFAPDAFVDTFRPDEFKGDFGDFFIGDDFQPGAFDNLFDPGEFRPDEFGSFFAVDEFKPGDFGEFAAVGDNFIDFGGHFEQFWGDRDEGAEQASNFFDGIAPGEFGFIPPEDLVGELQNMDYQGFQNMDSNFVADLFQNGVGGQDLDLRGDQWAGAFSKFDVEDIQGFDQYFISGAVHDFAPQDFLGIPDDQAFAMFEAIFLDRPPQGAPLEGEPLPDGSFIGGPAGGAPFDPGAFGLRLDEFEGQIGGFLGAMGPENFDKIEDGQLVDMFGRIDFLAEDFDPTVLGGEDLGGIFGALDHGSFADMGKDQIMGAIGGLGAKDFKDWDPGAAFNVFDNIDFEQAVGMEHMGGLVGAMGPNEFHNIEGDQLLGLFDSFAFGGAEFDLGTSGMDRDDIAGMMGAMDLDHMSELGSEGMIGALQHLDDKAMGAWDGGTAFNVFNSFGFEEALDIDQLEGIVANFAPEQILEMGENLGGLLGGLDFQNNGELLQGFSFDTLGVLSPEEFESLGLGQLADLANTVGGDGLVGLNPDQVHTMVESIKADGFDDFDPSVVGGMFAGLDHEQIGDFDHDAMEAALEAAGADLLGGLGDFDGISGANTAFDELANLADFDAALGQDGDSVIQEGAVGIFGGDLFISN